MTSEMTASARSPGTAAANGDPTRVGREAARPAGGRRQPTALLAGELAEFHGYDVCQLLGMATRTGVLRITTHGMRGEVYLENGRVVAARSRPNPRRLGRILREAGVVADDTILSALATQIDGHRARLGELLLARGAVDGATLKQALVLQAEVALQALLILPVGRFAFTAGPVPPELPRLEVDVQTLVLDALARLDELRAASGAG